MRRFRREIYTAILEAFINDGPMRLTKLTYKANVNHKTLKEMIKDLLADGLVEERKLKNATVYSATPKAKEALAKLKEA
jgi:predicted transcriptional regulator